MGIDKVNALIVLITELGNGQIAVIPITSAVIKFVDISVVEFVAFSLLKR
jgi:hypothetical protein